MILVLNEGTRTKMPAMIEASGRRSSSRIASSPWASPQGEPHGEADPADKARHLGRLAL